MEEISEMEEGKDLFFRGRGGNILYELCPANSNSFLCGGEEDSEV